MVGGVIGIVLAVVVAAGAACMLTRKNYGLALTAAVLGCICCASPFGIPFGIWAEVLLNQDMYKRQF